MNRIFIALDFETTGLDPQQDRIIEIGAVKFHEDGQILDTFQKFANPGMPIPAVATAVHGIVQDDIQDAASPRQVWDEFLAWAGDTCTAFVAHNAGFEIGFIQTLYGGAAQMPPLPFVDTLRLARQYLPDLPSYRLTDLVRDWSGDHHRARHDADACARLMSRIAATCPFGQLPDTYVRPAHDYPAVTNAPTQRQRDYIRRLGGNLRRPTTKRQASQYIETLLANSPRDARRRLLQRIILMLLAALIIWVVFKP